jgi:hypothetical protein
MTDAKKPTGCLQCGYAPTRSRLSRIHCAKCGKPLKTNRHIFPESSVRPIATVSLTLLGKPTADALRRAGVGVSSPGATGMSSLSFGTTDSCPRSLPSRWVPRVAAVWAIWSSAILFLAAAAASLPVHAHGDTAWGPALTAQAPPLARWDSGWYLGIAQNGYHYDPGARVGNIHFYPLYPLVVGLVWRLTGLPILWTGIACSLVSLLGALLFIADLLEEASPGMALPAIAALLIFPTAYYFAAFYTESLFLLATAAAFWGARRRHWWVCAIASAAAGLTRLNGALIGIPVAWLAWTDAGRTLRGLRARHLAAAAGAIVGAVAFPLFLKIRFGAPFVYLGSAPSAWPHGPTPFWHLLREIGGRLSSGGTGFGGGSRMALLFELGSLLFFAVLTLGLFARRLLPEALYCAATILLLLDSGSVGAVHRYLLPLFPVFLVLAEWLRRRPLLAFAYGLGGVGSLIALMTRFVNWLWVA